MFEILYQDTEILAVNKPTGWAVHASKLVQGEKVLLQKLREQTGQFLYPVHRLDVGTSGVLIFALNSESASNLGIQFRENLVQKEYLALARGWILEPITIEKPLAKLNKREEREALTLFRSLVRYDLPFAIGKYERSRVQWLECIPKTGIYHQIRRHANRLNCPLIGDRAHGDNRYNHFFKEQFQNERLLLHCAGMSVKGMDGTEIKIAASLDAATHNILDQLEIFKI